MFIIKKKNDTFKNKILLKMWKIPNLLQYVY